MEHVRERARVQFSEAAHDLRALLLETKEDAAPPPEDELERWHAAMSRPMPKTRYSNALERILGEPPARYLACAYRDADAAFGGGASGTPSLSGLSAEALREGAPPASEPTRAELYWHHVSELNRTACLACGVTPQRVPARDEIQENIRRHKAARERVASATEDTPTASSMAQGFASALGELAEQLRTEDALAADALQAHIAAHTPAQLLEEWLAMLNAQPSLERGGEGEWSALPSAACAAVMRTLADGDEKAARELRAELMRISGFCRVQAHVPSGMMSQIEKYALKVADGLEQNGGELDLTRMGSSLEAMGREVLAGCSSDDMDAMLSNLGHMLPALQASLGAIK